MRGTILVTHTEKEGNEMSQKTNTIATLNELIQMHHDRIEGYKLASRVLKEEDKQMIPLFENCCEESRNYIAQLAEMVWQLDGKTTLRTSFSGKLFRFWMQLKTNLLHQNRATIIGLCLFGEYALQKAYETVQNRADGLLDDAATLITNQQTILKRNYHIQKETYHQPFMVA